MSKLQERVVWLLLLAAVVSIAAYIGYEAARQKYERKAVGNLDLQTLVYANTLTILHEHPDEVKPMLETAMDFQVGTIWDLGRGWPEVTNTLKEVRRYRLAYPDYSPDPTSEQGRRFRQTQQILEQIQP